MWFAWTRLRRKFERTRQSSLSWSTRDRTRRVASRRCCIKIDHPLRRRSEGIMRDFAPFALVPGWRLRHVVGVADDSVLFRALKDILLVTRVWFSSRAWPLGRRVGYMESRGRTALRRQAGDHLSYRCRTRDCHSGRTLILLRGRRTVG